MPYKKNIYEILNLLQVDENEGVHSSEIEDRRLQFGRNELNKKKKRSVVIHFMDQLKDPMVFILLIGTVFSIILKEYLDAFIILFVIILNAVVGVIQEYKAEKAIDALEKLSSPKAKVIRDGLLQEINSNELVVGDLVELEAGNYISADIRLLISSNLKVEESTLTGESEPVEKDAELLYYEKQEISDQKNMVFMSTFVTYGKARGIVTAVGMQSEVGKIAAMLTSDNDEMTPLQVKLTKLSKTLGIISVIICISMFLVAILQGRNFLDMLMLSISLAVAAIPEGLAAVVTIVLAMGVQTMSKNKAIIRKLHAVETLGSVSVICSDKTGTLTQNKMHVVSMFGDGAMNQYNEQMLLGFTLCNNATLQHQEVIGEPTEKALLEFTLKQGMNKNEVEKVWKRVKELSFDSNRKMMTTMYTSSQGKYLYTKGALEQVLEKCSHVLFHNKTIPLTMKEKQQIIYQAQLISEDAQRVLATAFKKISNTETNIKENELCFTGFVGLMDPPRPEVKEAINKSHDAGIQVVMITGDHPSTALAIAKNLGIANKKEQVMSGKELDEISDEGLSRIIMRFKIFARVTPVHKVRIVNAYKRSGNIVAMSGDGVNDAPSLKAADIGIAMGITGTDVSKQASDMILIDDNFATIVTAVEEGRNIYQNIQKAVLYLLSCNLGEIMSMFLSIILMPNVVSILSAIQILWTNLVTDALPALALGVDPKNKFLMKERPRNREESLFAHGGMGFTILNGMYIGTVTIVAFRYGLNVNTTIAQTMAFMVLSLAQMFHCLNLRSRTHSVFEVGIFKNKWLVLTVVFVICLQVMVCEFPFFNILLKTAPLNQIQWIIVFGLSSSIIMINEISKLFENKK